MVSNKEKNFVSAVLYVHNNEKHIQYFLKKLNGVLQDHFEKYEIICVNDASVDGSLAKIKEFAKDTENTMINIINMSFYQGVELSMNAGMDLAIGDFVYEFDTIYIDYEIETIFEVYQRSLAGYDIVRAATKKNKRVSSNLFYRLFNSCSNNPNKLCTETFRILSRRAINRVNSSNKTIPYRKAIYANCGLKLDIIYYDSIRIQEMVGSRELNEKRKAMAVDSLILFTDIAYRVTLIVTFVMMFAAIFVGGYTVYVFISQKPVAGWTTTMLFLACGFFGIFAILAVIIKYLSILVDLVFKKKTYIIESIEKLTK